MASVAPHRATDGAPAPHDRFRDGKQSPGEARSQTVARRHVDRPACIAVRQVGDTFIVFGDGQDAEIQRRLVLLRGPRLHAGREACADDLGGDVGIQQPANQRAMSRPTSRSRVRSRPSTLRLSMTGMACKGAAMAAYRVFDIDYDTDGAKIGNLPKELILELERQASVACDGRHRQASRIRRCRRPPQRGRTPYQRRCQMTGWPRKLPDGSRHPEPAVQTRPGPSADARAPTGFAASRRLRRLCRGPWHPALRPPMPHSAATARRTHWSRERDPASPSATFRHQGLESRLST